MSYAEFPHTNYEDTDFLELIKLYRKVESEYNGTLSEILELSRRLDEYQTTMNQVIKEMVDRNVEVSVKNFGSTIESSIKALEQSDVSINNRITNNTTLIDGNTNKLKSEINNEISAREVGDNNLSNRINNVALQVTNDRNNFAKQIENVTNDYNSKFESFSLELSDATAAALEEAVATSTLYTAKQLSALSSELNSKIDSVVDNTNYETIVNLWKYGCYAGGLSAKQWYFKSEITCDKWNKYNPTCIEWYVEGKDVFRMFSDMDKMFDPVTGRWVRIQTAVMHLAEALNINAITAGDYDKLELTADEYDRIFLNAVEYDWKGDLICSQKAQNF